MNKIPIFLFIFVFSISIIPNAFAIGDMDDVLEKLKIETGDPTGKDIKIAVIDSSFCITEEGYPNEIKNVEFTKKFDDTRTFLNGAKSCSTSHGTNVAKVINEIAPDAKLYLYQPDAFGDAPNTPFPQIEFNFVNAVSDAIANRDIDIITTSLVFPYPQAHFVGNGDGYLTGESYVSKTISKLVNNLDIPMFAAIGNDGQGVITIDFEDSGEKVNNLITHKFQNNNSIKDACLRLSVSPDLVIPTIEMYWDGWPARSYDYTMMLYDTNMQTLKANSTPLSDIPRALLNIPSSTLPENYCLVVSTDEIQPSDNITLRFTAQNKNSAVDMVLENLKNAPTSLSSPADGDHINAVGAVDFLIGDIEPYSSVGPTRDDRPKPEICGYAKFDLLDNGKFITGTSFSTPMVAAVSSLILEEDTTRDGDALLTELYSRAIPTDDNLAKDNLCGAGVVQYEKTESSGNVTCDANGVCQINSGGGNNNSGTAPTAQIKSISGTITSGDTVTLNATGSTGSGTLSYSWSQIWHSSSNTPKVKVTNDKTDTATIRIPYTETSFTTEFEVRVNVSNTEGNDYATIKFNADLKPSSPVTESTPASNEIIKLLFEEQFTNFGSWIEGSNWDTDGPEVLFVLDPNDEVATVEECDDESSCTLIMKEGHQLLNYDKAKLSFWTWFGEDIDLDDTLKVYMGYQKAGSNDLSSDRTEWELVKTLKVSESEFENWFQTTIDITKNDIDFRQDVGFKFVADLKDDDSFIQIDALKFSGINIDNDAPVFSSVNDISHISNSQNGMIVDYDSPTANDANKGDRTVTCNPLSGSFFNNGTTTVTCKANDGVGNNAQTTFDVTISYQELEAPSQPTVSSSSHDKVTISWQAPQTSFVIDGYDIYRSSSPFVYLSTVNGTTTSYSDTTVNHSTNYQYKIIANSATGQSQDSDIISVTTPSNDITAPILTVPNDKTFEATAFLTPLNVTQIGNATATDNIDSNPVIKNNVTGTFALGDTVILWNATDSVGNVSNATQIITIQDISAPIITLLGNLTESLIIGQSYIDGGATATDIYDGNLTASIITQGSVDVTASGNYTITFDVADSSGNDAQTKSRTIIVNEPPVAITPPSQPQNLQYSSTIINATLTWDAPNDDGGSDISLYKIIYRENKNDPWINLGTSKTQSFVVDDPSIDTTKKYVFVVMAYNGVITGEGQGIALEFKQPSVPEPPTNVAITKQNDKFIISWDYPEFDGNYIIEKYQIAYKKSGTGHWIWNPTKIQTTLDSFDLSQNLNEHQKIDSSDYDIKMLAYNKMGYSEPTFATTITSGDISDPPQNFVLVRNGTHITLTWNEPEKSGDSDIVSYPIFIIHKNSDMEFGQLTKFTKFYPLIMTLLF